MTTDRRQLKPLLKAQDQLTMTLHRVPGVKGDVDQCRFKLTGVRLDLTGLVGQLDIDVYARAGQRIKHFADGADTLPHIEDLRVQGLAP